MLGKAFICIVAAAHVTELSQKGKYFLIEVKTKGNSKKDQVNCGVSCQKKLGLMDEYGDETDYSKTEKDSVLTEEGN